MLGFESGALNPKPNPEPKIGPRRPCASASSSAVWGMFATECLLSRVLGLGFRV